MDRATQGGGATEAQAGGGSVAMDTSAAISDPAHFDAALWPMREQLAAAYRVCYTLGLNRMTYNHLSTDCGGGRFLVNRYGLSWREVTAANLCLVGTDGRLIEGEGPVMTAAFMIHAAIHETLGACARVVMHTHQEAATALTALRLNVTDGAPCLGAYPKEYQQLEHEKLRQFPMVAKRHPPVRGRARCRLTCLP